MLDCRITLSLFWPPCKQGRQCGGIKLQCTIKKIKGLTNIFPTIEVIFLDHHCKENDYDYGYDYFLTMVFQFITRILFCVKITLPQMVTFQFQNMSKFTTAFVISLMYEQKLGFGI